MMKIFSYEILNKYVLEILFGISAAAIVFDRFRFFGKIGIGEILLAIMVYISAIKIFSRISTIQVDNIGIIYAFLLNIFLFIIILPITLWSGYLQIYGSSIIELFGYLSSFLFILSISLLRLNHHIIGAIIVFVATFLSFAFIGASESWAGDVRFSGGSKNPNRLAIYLLASIVIISQLNFRSLYKFFLFTFICILIYTTLSDAAGLGLVALALSYLFFSGFRSPYVLPFFLIIFLLCIVFAVQNFDAILRFAIDAWYAASNSNVRFNLIENGVIAWTQHPLTIFIGHGAGSFSGYGGPFEGWESHSTPIDLLSIGGILGFSIFYFPIFFSIFKFIKFKQNFAASALIALIIFSLFTFIARHPVTWFAIYFSLMNCMIYSSSYKNLQD